MYPFNIKTHLIVKLHRREDDNVTCKTRKVGYEKNKTLAKNVKQRKNEHHFTKQNIPVKLKTENHEP